jgi:CBS domain-containing protein
MLVREVMTKEVVTVRRTDPVRQAVRVLYAAGVTAVPVLDGNGRLVGIVSEMDLLRGEFQRDPRASARAVLGLRVPAPGEIRKRSGSGRAGPSEDIRAGFPSSTGENP